jgi:hypothetical protein
MMSEEAQRFTINAGDHFTAYSSNGGLLFGGRCEEWLPNEPLDVDERVYATLGDRTFYGYADDSEMPLADFIDELNALARKAPKRAEVIIKFGTEGCYDDPPSPSYEVGYWRDPTKKERAEREETNRKLAARDAKRAEAATTQERAEYERLKAKFEA